MDGFGFFPDPRPITLSRSSLAPSAWRVSFSFNRLKPVFYRFPTSRYRSNSHPLTTQSLRHTRITFLTVIPPRAVLAVLTFTKAACGYSIHNLNLLFSMSFLGIIFMLSVHVSVFKQLSCYINQRLKLIHEHIHRKLLLLYVSVLDERATGARRFARFHVSACCGRFVVHASINVHRANKKRTFCVIHVFTF